jgi:hypothetical protein
VPSTRVREPELLLLGARVSAACAAAALSVEKGAADHALSEDGLINQRGRGLRGFGEDQRVAKLDAVGVLDADGDHDKEEEQQTERAENNGEYVRIETVGIESRESRPERPESNPFSTARATHAACANLGPNR